MRDPADIQIIAGIIDDLYQLINRGHFLRPADQIQKQLLLHDIGIHEDIFFLRRAAVSLQR